MSFDIPIMFDESPFFEWGAMRSPERRRNYQDSPRSRQPTRPSVFGEWIVPDILYEHPRRKQHLYRPKYGERQPELAEFVRESPQFAQGDIGTTEEQRGTPRSNFGFDGWDIPVKYVEKNERRRKLSGQMSGGRKEDANIQTSSDEGPQQPVQKTEAAVEAVSDTGIEPQPSTSDEVNIEMKSKIIPERDMEQQASSNSQTPESVNSESIEIPISYSPPKNAHPKLFRRLSQCDPPSPADVKIARIQSILQKIEGIEEKISEFADAAQNKAYLYISETLMKTLLDLDTVDSDGLESVRKARKEGVRTVQALVDQLEAKLAENKRTVNPD